MTGIKVGMSPLIALGTAALVDRRGAGAGSGAPAALMCPISAWLCSVGHRMSRVSELCHYEQRGSLAGPGLLCAELPGGLRDARCVGQPRGCRQIY